MAKFVSRHQLTGIPQIPDGNNNDLWLSYGIRSQPAWVLVRADGSTEIGFGAIDNSIIEEAGGA